MNMEKSKKLLAWLAAAYWIMVSVIYLVAGDQFRLTILETETLSASMATGELTDGLIVTQKLELPAAEVNALSLLAGTYERQNTGVLHLTLTDASGAVLLEQDVPVESLSNGTYTAIPFDESITARSGETVLLTLTTTGCAPGNAVTLYAGNSVSAGRFDVAQPVAAEDCYAISGTAGLGRLCVRLSGVERLWFYKAYWPAAAAAFAICTLLCMHWWRLTLRGRNNPLAVVCTLYTRYGFLIRQLVARDFKTKYKRSVLGMAWSFLNPLLTMSVQYVVFSTLFKSDIPNYPVYLLTGIVFMNFFSEAITMGMTSITSNAALIKKVYIPKYIFPFARVASSLVNFALAIIPLFLVMLVTRTAFRPSLLLLAFDILCLLGFVAGMGLLLTTAMTFFQDTQFLWSVVSLIWMYLTPVFYPENIIPARLLPLYRMNPMYQYITFARTCIIDGVSPAPASYLWCLLSSAVVLLLGLAVFKKKQDKFVLYL